jgi:hypothetical protein
MFWSLLVSKLEDAHRRLVQDEHSARAALSMLLLFVFKHGEWLFNLNRTEGLFA